MRLLWAAIVAAAACWPSPVLALEAKGDSVPTAHALDLELQLRAGSRLLSYDQQLRTSGAESGDLEGLELPVAPGIGLAAGWYPITHFRDRPAIEPGLVGGYRQEALFTTAPILRGELTIRSFEWWAGLRLRVPWGMHELGATTALGGHSFELDGASRDTTSVPDVGWAYFRLALDGRADLGDFSIGGAVGRRFIVSVGEIQTPALYQTIDTTGFDLSFYLGVPLSSSLELSVGYELRRYFFTGTAQRSGETVTGSGVDIYGSGFVAFEYQL